MGTRSLLIIMKDNEYKVAQYGQWDGYLSGQGLDILKFLKNDFNKQLFENQLSKISYISSEEELMQMWVEAGAKPDDKTVGEKIFNKFKQLYPENHRDTGYKILEIIQNTNKPLRIINDIDFVNDLLCDYVYVIDLDKNIFEIYKGQNKLILGKEERFYSNKPNKYGYYPVKFLCKFNLNDLPSEDEFLALEPK